VEYYPNNIGNLVVGSSQTYSFLVYGREDRGVQLQILNSLFKRGARIISQTGYVDGKTREFTLSVSCDLSEVSVTPDDLVIELRRIKSVKNAIAVCLKNRMFDGFLFPLTMMLTSRVVAVDSNLSFLIQDRLNSETSNLALRDVGRAYAIDIAKQVREKLGATFSEAVIQDNVKDFFKASGWGSISWTSESNFERVSIIDPPIYSGKATGNYFVQGIASGVIEAFRKKNFVVAEEVYNQDTRSLTIMLAEVRVELKKLEIPSVEIKALEEVEKVIRSVELDELETEVTPLQMTEQKPIVVLEQSAKGKSSTKTVNSVSQNNLFETVTPLSEARKERSKGKSIFELVPDDLEMEDIASGPPVVKPEVAKDVLPVAVREPVEVKEVSPSAKEPIDTKEALAPTKETPVKEPDETEPAPSVLQRKPVRITEIKGIREHEDDFEEEEDEVWFERAVQEE